jgi:hypothetical protein
MKNGDGDDDDVAFNLSTGIFPVSSIEDHLNDDNSPAAEGTLGGGVRPGSSGELW